jgi:phosphoserine aminotransferase
VTQRVYNFSSEPAMLPEEVLREAQGELLPWHGRGYSIMAASHHSEEFVAILEQVEDVRVMVDFMRDFERRRG